MATIKLVCQQCKHAFTVSTRGAIKDKQKSCPECRSHEVRQTLGSFLSNAVVIDVWRGPHRRLRLRPLTRGAVALLTRSDPGILSARRRCVVSGLQPAFGADPLSFDQPLDRDSGSAYI